MKKIIFLLLLIFTSFSFSQTEETELYSELKKADKELNKVYNNLKSKLETVDKNALVNAQNAWIKFRDLNCKFRSQEDSEGGVMSNKMKIDCLIELTLKRTEELKSLTEGF